MQFIVRITEEMLTRDSVSKKIYYRINFHRAITSRDITFDNAAEIYARRTKKASWWFAKAEEWEEG